LISEPSGLAIYLDKSAGLLDFITNSVKWGVHTDRTCLLWHACSI